MLTWWLMRQHAMWRHSQVNYWLEGGCPVRWKQHEAMVRAFYGF
jgi:hypothetical protein